jgi:hypothetical protein
MIKLLAALLGFMVAGLPARAEVSPQGALMVANVAGKCDTLYAMVEFQKKNGVSGGEEYVARFWAAEAEKQGLTAEQLSDRCNRTAAAYGKLWGSVTSKQGAADGNE